MRSTQPLIQFPSIFQKPKAKWSNSFFYRNFANFSEGDKIRNFGPTEPQNPYSSFRCLISFPRKPNFGLQIWIMMMIVRKEGHWKCKWTGTFFLICSLSHVFMVLSDDCRIIFSEAIYGRFVDLWFLQSNWISCERQFVYKLCEN